MHLSELRSINPKAYEAYVEMLVEDCHDEFEVVDGAVKAVVEGDHDHLLRLEWRGDGATSEGWEVIDWSPRTSG